MHAHNGGGAPSIHRPQGKRKACQPDDAESDSVTRPIPVDWSLDNPLTAAVDVTVPPDVVIYCHPLVRIHVHGHDYVAKHLQAESSGLPRSS